MTDEINYKVIGDSAQILEINIEPEKTIIADGGALLYLDEEITFLTRDTDGADEVAEEDEMQEESDETGDLENTKEFSMDEDSLENALPSSEFGFSPRDEVTEDMAEEHSNEGNEQASLLEKLWVATRKFVKKVSTKKTTEEGENNEENEDSTFSDSLGNLNLEEGMSDDFPEGMPEEEATPSWYITHFTNESEYIRKIGFTTSNSGVVTKIDLNDLLDGEIIVQTGTFLCARKGVHIEKFMDTGISVTFTKEKFFNLDKINGKGSIFLQVEGQVIEKELKNAAIWVNLFSLVAFEASLEIDTQNTMKVQSMRYEDDTQFVMLMGTGKYWLQTANIQQLVYRISPFIFETPEVYDEEVQNQVKELPPSVMEGLMDGEGEMIPQEDTESEDESVIASQEEKELPLPRPSLEDPEFNLDDL